MQPRGNADAARFAPPESGRLFFAAGRLWDYGLNPKMVSVPAPTPPLLAT